MNRKILLIVSALALFLLATPIVGTAMAEPTKGQKVAVTLIFKFPFVSRTIVDEWYANGVRHRLWEVTFNVELIINGGPTLEGTAFVERKDTTVMPKGKDRGKAIIVDYYMFTFGDGGFEGNGLVMLDGFISGTWEVVLGIGLFHGTKAFEEQTLNLRTPWGASAWTGHWLKYQG